jgi:glucokinase
MLLGAIDIGGTKTLIAVVNENGKILSKNQMETDTFSLSAWLQVCADTLKECLTSAGHQMEDLTGIGINLPGMVDIERGFLLKCSYPGWELLPAREMMRELTGVHNIFVENDVSIIFCRPIPKDLFFLPSNNIIA